MSATETEYVSQKIFDLQPACQQTRHDNFKSQTNSECERVDNKLEKNQAIADKNMAEVKSMFAEIRAEIKSVDKKVDYIDGKLTVLINSNNDRITGLEKRFDDMKEYQNKWFTVFGILFAVAAIVAPLATAVVQHFMTR